MLKRKLLFFALFIFLVFGLLTYQSINGKGTFLDLPLYPLRLLEKGASGIIAGVENFFSTYVMITGKEEENRNLLKKISTLQQELNSCREIEIENQRLANILGLKSVRPDYITAAKVFARDPTNWFQTLWINKGRKDGLTKDMVAIGDYGPVGRVRRVNENVSGILLITDVNSSVAVRLQSSRVEGILEGRGDNTCYLKYISKEVEVKVGENLITSGLDGIYPGELLIGHISSVVQKEEEMFQVIEVTPAQYLHSIEEVAIFKR